MPETELLYQNCPSCPDIKKKIDRIDLALMGLDGTGMKDGIVKAITDLQKSIRVQASWIGIGKPIVVAVLSSLITAAVMYGIFAVHPW